MGWRVQDWAEANGFTKQTVWRWIREDKLPSNLSVTVTPTGRYILEDANEPSPYFPDTREKTRCVCYARVSSDDREADLERQGDRLKAFAINLGYDNAEVVREVASGVDGERPKLNKILSDRTLSPIIVEHRDRLARMNAELIMAALESEDRKVIVIDDTELDDDLVEDVISVMTSFCARLYGRRSARRRAEAALRAAEDG